MPNLPDIPGKSLIGGTTKRARLVATAGAGAVLAVGGVVAKRLLGHGGKDDGAKDGGATDVVGRRAEADDKVVPIAKEKAPPKPKPGGKPKPKPKASKPKASKAKSAKPKPAAKPKSAAPKPKTAAPTPKPDSEPGNRSHDKGPHQALNNPVGEPDETEYPDPFETRPDPRAPIDPDGEPFGEEPHPVTGAESTSEPPLENDPEQPEGGRPPRRDNLDQ